MSQDPRYIEKKPLYLLVEDFVCQEIAHGRLKPGDMLLSEMDLSQHLGVSQGTARRGLDVLVSQGLLYRRQGVGTFVSTKNKDWGSLGLYRLDTQDARVYIPRQEVLSIQTTHADEYIAYRLALRKMTPVWRVISVWRCGPIKVALDEAFLSAAKFERLNTRYVPSTGGLYDQLNRYYGVHIEAEDSLLSLGTLSTAEAKLLNAVAGLPSVMLSRLSKARKEEKIEFRKRILPATQFGLVLTPP